MPSSVILIGPSVRFNACPSSCADARMSSRFLVRKIPRSKRLCLLQPNSISKRERLPRSLPRKVRKVKSQRQKPNIENRELQIAKLHGRPTPHRNLQFSFFNFQSSFSRSEERRVGK